VRRGRGVGHERRELRARASAARRRLEFHVTGGTTLLTQAYAPAEKARTQGINDAIVFATMGVSSFSSGLLVSAAGWNAMNAGALPLLALVAGAVLWHAWRRRSHASVNPAR
jgi:hypothetical protein